MLATDRNKDWRFVDEFFTIAIITKTIQQQHVYVVSYLLIVKSTTKTLVKINSSKKETKKGEREVRPRQGEAEASTVRERQLERQCDNKARRVLGEQDKT